jgi:hypothetical protein
VEEREKLREGLRELIGEYLDALAYVPEWARKKWGYDAVAERAAALLGKDGTHG